MGQIETIVSRDNRRLVNARNVRDGRIEGQIFVEGRRLVSEALRSNLQLNEAFVSDNFADDELLGDLKDSMERLSELPSKLFSTIADTDHSQGIIVIADRPKSGRDKIEETLSSILSPLVMFLKEINNPSNLGAILRSAEAAGVAGVVISSNSADPFSPKALRSSMGSGFRLPVWEGISFGECLEWAEIHDLIATAADVSAAESYTKIDWKLPRLLVFGSEAHGLNAEELEQIEEKIKIPMQNNVESLNLAVSAAVLMFEAQRQASSSD